MLKALIVVVAVNGVAVACGTGCEPHGEVCACDAKPSDLGPMHATNWASDEAPPRHPEPAWQRGEVRAETPASLVMDDEKQDREKSTADAAGKFAAGLSTKPYER